MKRPPRCGSVLLAAWTLIGCAQLPINLGPPPPREFKPPSGAVNEAVTQANVRRTICSPHWSAGVQLSAASLQEAKSRLLKAHGLGDGEASRYEVDLLIPVGLGGHPRKPENVWLVPSGGAWGVRTKDRLEAKLRQLVCSGEISLQEARDAVRTDWKMAARYYLSDRELLAPIE